MLKLIASLIPFIKELFFDSKEEMDITHSSFNPKKWIQYISFIILFSLLLFTGGRLVGITNKFIKLEKEHEALLKVNDEQKNKIDNLENENEVLSEKSRFLDSHCYPYPPKVKVKKSDS